MLVSRALLVLDVKEMSTNAFRTHVHLLVPRSASNWLTIIIASVKMDGWVVTVKRRETFVKEVLAKMAEFVPAKMKATIALVLRGSLGQIASSLAPAATARPVATEGPVSTAEMELNLHAYALLVQPEKHVNKTPEMNVPMIPVNKDSA